jgi:hypothetical protein
VSRADSNRPRVDQLHVKEDIMGFRDLVPWTKGQQLSTGQEAFDPYQHQLKHKGGGVTAASLISTRLSSKGAKGDTP